METWIDIPGKQAGGLLKTRQHFQITAGLTVLWKRAVILPGEAGQGLHLSDARLSPTLSNQSQHSAEEYLNRLEVNVQIIFRRCSNNIAIC